MSVVENKTVKPADIVYVGDSDWKCDFCKKPESEVGNLSSGRFKSGWDYQVCKSCKEEKTFNDLKTRENNC